MDVFIESKIISDAKKMNKLNMWMAMMNQAVALDKNANIRWMLKQTFQMGGATMDEINRALPKSFDEYEAEQENMLLDKNKLPKILMTQNHMVHLEIHSKAADTKAKQHHIDMHLMALYGQTHNQNLAPPPMIGPDGQPLQGQEPGTQPATPMSQGLTPSPRDMAQSPLQIQAPNAIQQAQ